MNARMSVIAVWVVVVLLAGGGAVAASSGYRHYAELARLKDAAVADANSRVSEMASLAHRVAVLEEVLSFERAERRSAQRTLTLTRTLLQDAIAQLERTQGATGDLRRENAVLRACLAGTLAAVPLLGNGDNLHAMQVMMSVDRPCRTAHQALYMSVVQPNR